VPINIDFAGSIENILRVLPDTTNIAVVIGNSPHEKDVFERRPGAFQPFTDRVTFTWFNELSLNEMMKRAARLPPHSAIFWFGLIVDAAGVSHQEFDAMTLLRAVANAPIFSFIDAYLGKGIVGGPLISVRDVARATAQAAVRILDGEKASDVTTSPIGFGSPKFDWRELQRWNISESRLPPGSKVLFQPPTAWDQYQRQVILIAAAFLLQSALIAGLVFEHRRRRNAEILARHSMGELANRNRVATASALSASIAHEMKQPLAAMVTNVGAGLRWLGATEPNLEETRVALQNVVKDGNRAAEVIDSVRAMFKKESTGKTQLNLNDLISSMLYLLRDELQPQDIILRTNLDPQLPPVQGHRGELQQVFVNLIRNAADAMKDITYRPRVLAVKSEVQSPNDVLISVADSGTGIDTKDVDHIFDAFFTTKPNGMGMGLSICRSIIEDHSGRLWALPDLKHGSVFIISLPIHQDGMKQRFGSGPVIFAFVPHGWSGRILDLEPLDRMKINVCFMASTREPLSNVPSAETRAKRAGFLLLLSVALLAVILCFSSVQMSFGGWHPQSRCRRQSSLRWLVGQFVGTWHRACLY
ncbi:MAG: HAMP domain-containing sensor histidine kinase, partial [Xanthobacteraceae bacterium]